MQNQNKNKNKYPPLKSLTSIGGDTATLGGKKQYSSTNLFKHKNNIIFFRTVTKSQKMKKTKIIKTKLFNFSCSFKICLVNK